MKIKSVSMPELQMLEGMHSPSSLFFVRALCCVARAPKADLGVFSIQVTVYLASVIPAHTLVSVTIMHICKHAPGN